MAPNPTTDLQELAGNAEVATNLTLGLSLGGFVTPDPNENKMVTSLPPVTSPAMLQLVRRNDSSSSIKMEEKFRMMKKWQNLVKRESNEKMAARSDIMKIEGGANVGGGGGGGLGLVVTPIRKTVGPVGAWPLVVNVNSGPQRISTSSGGSSGGGSDMQGLGASGLSNSGDVQSPSIQPPSPTKKACFESKQDGRLVTKKPQTEARRNGLTESEDRRKELTETEVRRDVLTETGARRNGPRETMKTLMEEMPSVYTKGRGGRIEGFIYKYKKRDVSIVCLCHGKFFTPKEFVEHAGGRDVAVPSRHIFITP